MYVSDIYASEIDQVRALLAHTPDDLTRDELRAMYDGIGTGFPTPPDVTLEDVEANGVPGEWSAAPGAVARRVILYLHGGGYVFGSPASHRHLAAALGRAAKTRCLALGYRLAPEHPFPAAVEDALAGYRFLLESGIAPGDIALAGDAAGGGLTVATLVAAREAGLPQPACGLCISPWVDLEGLGASMTTKADEDPIVQKEGLLGRAEAYLAGTSPRTPLAAPLHADLRGIAPLLIHVGSCEILLDDAVRLAGAAGAAMVDVRLEVWPGMVHVWHFFHPMLSDGRRALEAAGSYIMQRMDAAPEPSTAH